MISLLTEMLALLRAQVRDEVRRAPEPEPPEPPRLRPSQQAGIDMNDLRRAFDRERSQRRLPRSPEEARKPRWYG